MRTVTISSKGQIAIPKEIRETLNIKAGDRLTFKVAEGKLVLEPVINIPRSQAWFWTEEVQARIRGAEENFRAGNFKRYDDVDDFLKELKE